MRFGHTTALEITEAADVRRLGRDIIERLGISGVAKLDFKRDMQGQLRLLESIHALRSGIIPLLLPA